MYECDLVLLAMGFLGPEQTILEELSLSHDVRGNIDTSNVKYVTTSARVYAAGGMFRAVRVQLFTARVSHRVLEYRLIPDVTN